MKGFGHKNNKTLGLSILEALMATVIVGVGFIAVFQMVNYSVDSVDLSGERTKVNYVAAMVAEDLIADKNTEYVDSGGVTRTFYESLKNENGWELTDCVKNSANAAHDNALGNKKVKWNNRLSKSRIKCKSDNDLKRLTIVEICKNGFLNHDDLADTYSGNCDFQNNTDYEPMASTKRLGVYFPPIVFGKMEIRMNDGRKRKYIYFPIK